MKLTTILLSLFSVAVMAAPAPVNAGAIEKRDYRFDVMYFVNEKRKKRAASHSTPTTNCSAPLKPRPTIWPVTTTQATSHTKAAPW